MWKMVRVAGLIFAAGCSFFLCETRLTASYRCGDPSSDHCYGTALWQEQPEYFGAYTDVLQARLNCPKGCGGFVDNEIWLVDNASAGCTSNKFGQCWVEAGSLFVDGEDGAHYFWADGRPLKSNTFNLHVLGPTDAVGVTSHYMLLNDARESKTRRSDIFQVWIYNDTLSTLYNGTSTNNAMIGNRIIIGQELAGTQNASADLTNFSRNIWAVQALGQEYVFWYNAQTTPGNVTSNNPPSGEWTIDPAKPPPEGGQFSTRCCS